VRINVTEHGACRLSVRVDVPESMAALPESELNAPGLQRQIDLLMAEEFKHFFLSRITPLAHVMRIMTWPSLRGVLSHPYSLFMAVRGVLRACAGIDNTSGPLGKANYSALPFRLGATGAMKFGMQPKQTQALKQAVGGRPGARLTGKEAEVARAYTAALASDFGPQASCDTDIVGPEIATWDFVVQPATDHPSHTIAVDGPWDEGASPYAPVGTLTLLAVPGAIVSAAMRAQAPPHYLLYCRGLTFDVLLLTFGVLLTGHRCAFQPLEPARGASPPR